MNRRASLAAAALFLACAASAQQFHYQPEPDFQSGAEQVVRSFMPKDAFAGVSACAVVDARFIAKVSLPDAQKMLVPCLQAVSAAYQTKVTVKEGTLTPTDRMSAQVEVLLLQVPQGTGVQSPVMRDLNKALSMRRGQLLGHPAAVVVEERKTPQEALDSCVLPMVVRSIENGADFIKAYGGCLRKTPEFGIVEMQPWPNRPRGVILLIKGDKPVADSLTTTVEVDSADGKVKVDLVAYTTPTHL